MENSKVLEGFRWVKIKESISSGGVDYRIFEMDGAFFWERFDKTDWVGFEIDSKSSSIFEAEALRMLKNHIEKIRKK